jgi:hypothetical protein
MTSRIIANIRREIRFGKHRLVKVSIVATLSIDSNDGRLETVMAANNATNAVECHGGIPLVRGGNDDDVGVVVVSCFSAILG